MSPGKGDHFKSMGVKCTKKQNLPAGRQGNVMNQRERFIRTMDFSTVDQVPNHELGVWGQTIDCWEREELRHSEPHSLRSV